MTHYEVLGVGPKASSAEIRKAYLKLAREWHPDKKKPGADAKFKEINEANAVLSDFVKRTDYDQSLQETVEKPAQDYTPPRSTYAPSARHTPNPYYTPPPQRVPSKTDALLDTLSNVVWWIHNTYNEIEEKLMMLLTIVLARCSTQQKIKNTPEAPSVNEEPPTVDKATKALKIAKDNLLSWNGKAIFKVKYKDKELSELVCKALLCLKHNNPAFSSLKIRGPDGLERLETDLNRLKEPFEPGALIKTLNDLQRRAPMDKPPLSLEDKDPELRSSPRCGG